MLLGINSAGLNAWLVSTQPTGLSSDQVQMQLGNNFNDEGTFDIVHQTCITEQKIESSSLRGGAPRTEKNKRLRRKQAAAAAALKNSERVLVFQMNADSSLESEDTSLLEPTWIKDEKEDQAEDLGNNDQLDDEKADGDSDIKSPFLQQMRTRLQGQFVMDRKQ